MLLKSSYLSEARWLMTTSGKHIMLVGAMVFIVPLALFGVAAPVQAAPSGIFPLFGDCPLVTFRALGVPPGRALCGFHQITSGELAIGSMRVPIEETITLQGGFTPTGNPENEQEFFVLSGANGESLSKTELNVPGGLPDFVKCEEITGNGIPEIIERGRCESALRKQGHRGYGDHGRRGQRERPGDLQRSRARVRRRHRAHSARADPPQKSTARESVLHRV